MLFWNCTWHKNWTVKSTFPHIHTGVVLLPIKMYYLNPSIWKLFSFNSVFVYLFLFVCLLIVCLFLIQSIYVRMETTAKCFLKKYTWFCYSAQPYLFLYPDLLGCSKNYNKNTEKKCSSKCYLLLHKFHCQSSKYLKVLSHPTLPGYLEWNCPIFPYSPVLLSSLFIYYPLRFFIWSQRHLSQPPTASFLWLPLVSIPTTMHINSGLP